MTEGIALKSSGNEDGVQKLELSTGHRFECPPELVGGVFEVWRGEYAMPGVTFEAPPSILDIGGHVGAFAAWAAVTWPGGTVDTYEPNPIALPYLVKNAEAFATSRYLGTDKGPREYGAKAITVHPVAVRSFAGKSVLRVGKHNLGESSFYDCGGQFPHAYGEVEHVDAGELPWAQILKIDTEGAELEILRRYLATHTAPMVVALEWHAPVDRIAIEKLLAEHGLYLLRGLIRTPHRGTSVFLKVKPEDLGKVGVDGLLAPPEAAHAP